MKKNRILFLDFETYSPVDIKTQGAYKYAQHAGVLCASYAFDKGAIKTIKNFSRKAFAFPPDVTQHISAGGLICAHNWAFEYYILTQALRVQADISQFICTAATARRYGQPGALDAVAKNLNLKKQKQKEKGSLLIQRYSIPQKNGLYKEVNKEDAKLWVEYSKADIATMRELFYKFPQLHTEPFESDIFASDKIVNTAGVKFDLAATGKLIALYEKTVEAVGRIAADTCGLTKDKKLVARSPIGLKTWLTSHGAPVSDTQEATLDAIYKTTKNVLVKKAIECRRILAASAPKKLYAIKEYADKNGVVRDVLAYYGAHTGRFAGRGVQIHNFYRDAHPDFFQGLNDVENAVGCGDYTNVSTDISRLLRGLIIPRQGKFAVGDFSAIEARGLFWLSGCQAGLQVYKDKKNIYIETAEKIFQKKVSKEKNLFEYTVGKAAVLGLGYGMGKDSFFDYCAGMGASIPEVLAETTVYAYRQLYYEVPRFWYDTERAFKACLHTGQTQTLGLGLRTLVFSITNDKTFLRIILPSGRAMYYYKPFLREEQGRQVIYCNFAHGGLKKIWGALLVENIVQAFCRDLLMYCVLEVEKTKNLMYAFTVHDEIVSETLDDKKGLDELKKIMETPPVWAKGFPLTAECKIMERYGK